MRSWGEIEARRGKLQLSRAEMCRRAGISESTVTKGLKNKSRVSSVIRKQIDLVLSLEERLQRDAAA